MLLTVSEALSKRLSDLARETNQSTIYYLELALEEFLDNHEEHLKQNYQKKKEAESKLK